MNTVFTRIYSAPPISKKDILRYLGAKASDGETDALLSECIELSKDIFTYKICYSEFDISFDKDKIDLGFTTLSSQNLKRNLQGCQKAIVFAATVGSGIDRLIARYSVNSASKALVLQAIGTERIESLCDRFNEEISEEKNSEGFICHPRFSPGYGDLSLDAQKKLLAALDSQRKIGITLTESLLMLPTKSVSAIIGLECRKGELLK